MAPANWIKKGKVHGNYSTLGIKLSLLVLVLISGNDYGCHSLKLNLAQSRPPRSLAEEAEFVLSSFQEARGLLLVAREQQDKEIRKSRTEESVQMLRMVTNRWRNIKGKFYSSVTSENASLLDETSRNVAHVRLFLSNIFLWELEDIRSAIYEYERACPSFLELSLKTFDSFNW